jgi:hypothetical protein
MKLISSFTILSIIVLFGLITAQGKDPRGFERTPKALDLEDHFGTEPVTNQYGPQARAGAHTVDLAREFDSVDGSRAFTPITNFSAEIRPNDVVSGHLDNTAYDASKIIKVQLADPKAEINTSFIHDVIVNTPVHVGTHHQTKTVMTQNRVTGEVSEKVVHSEKPIVAVVKNLRNIDTEKKTFLNIRKGTVYNTQMPTMLHGMDR